MDMIESSNQNILLESQSRATMGAKKQGFMILFTKKFNLPPAYWTSSTGGPFQNHLLLLLPPILDGGWYGLIYWAQGVAI